MMQWLKNNAVLALGITLPLLLMLVFMGMQRIQHRDSPPPQYTAVFALLLGHPQDAYAFNVSNGKLSISYTYKTDDEKITIEPDPVRLYKFDPITKHTEEFVIQPPADSKPNQTIAVEIPAALADLTLNPAPESPDGYTLVWNDNRNNNIVTDIFGYNGHNLLFLTNGKRRQSIPGLRDYYGRDHKLIGWVQK